MSDPSLDHNPVELLAEEFLARRRRGERPSVSEYAQQYPDLADQIRAFFPALILVEDLKPGDDDLTGSFPSASFLGRLATPERLGDFRIIREVGRGGMGIVYEAEQQSLGRRVALKILASPALMDPQKLARFHREAKAAARLHHTNIVPVFGVGEAGGLHYYVMQFIAGAGLDEVLEDVKRLHNLRSGIASENPAKEGNRAKDMHRTMSVAAARSLFEGVPAPLDSSGEVSASDSPAASERGKSANESAPDAAVGPSRSVLSTASETGACYTRSVARIGIQIAEALEHAHEQGTLHRDIKPSNILLDPHGTAWVTDFGLAKVDDDNDLTHTGDILGTIRYMAPERFRGACDARSDVYALGLTLYELLARRPAFEASDRNSLVQQVSLMDPPRLRKRDRSIPRDLETVVHKAIEKDPAHRYPTAGALADDLRRVLEDRPIEARRVTFSESLVRAARRNRLLAALTAAILLVSTVSTVFLWSQNATIRDEAAEIKDEAYRATRAAAAEVIARRDAEAGQVALRRTLYSAHMNLAQAAWEAGNVARMGRLLDQEVPHPGQTDLRGWEWS